MEDNVDIFYKNINKLCKKRIDETETEADNIDRLQANSGSASASNKITKNLMKKIIDPTQAEVDKVL